MECIMIIYNLYHKVIYFLYLVIVFITFNISGYAFSDSTSDSTIQNSNTSNMATDSHVHSKILEVSLTDAESKISKKIKSEIMSPCCYNGTLDLHQSPKATELSNQIDIWIKEGLTQDNIIEKLVAEYGEKILARPLFTGSGLLFYIIPITGLFLGAFLAFRWIKTHLSDKNSTNNNDSSGNKNQASRANARDVKYSKDAEDAFERELKEL